MVLTENISSNFSHVKTLCNEAEETQYGDYKVDSWVQDFLTHTNDGAKYATMVAALDFAVTNIAVGKNTGFRILVALDDGTVAYDSSKGDANQFANIGKMTNNPDTNVVSYLINENHNTRPEVLVAILSGTGTSISNRYSKSSKTYLKYFAKRLGTSTESNLGTFRVSLSDVIDV